MKKLLNSIKLFVEAIWLVLKTIWYLPPAIVEMAWFACFDREKFKTSIDYIKAAIKGKTLRQ